MQRVSALRRHLVSAAGMTKEPIVLTESVGKMRSIVLNRPKVLNALDLPMVRIMTPVVQSWNSDPDVAVILMKGAGPKAFCAGGDVVAVAKSGRGGEDGGALARDFFREEYQLDYLLAQLSKPYVAIIDGVTMGGGVGLSVPAKFRVATERSLFAMPETGIGLFPDVGGSWFLPRLPGSIGMYLAMTGARIKGQDIVEVGVATHFVDSSTLDELEHCLAKIESPDPDQVKAVLDQFDTRNVPTGMLEEHRKKIDRCFSAATVEEMLELLDAEGCEWTAKQAATMRRMSPTSMKITAKQLQLGASLTLEECFLMEYRMTQGCMRGTDFYEGIRALLIDRDNTPVWSPGTLAEVTDELVDSHFSPVDNDLHF